LDVLQQELFRNPSFARKKQTFLKKSSNFQNLIPLRHAFEAWTPGAWRFQPLGEQAILS